MVVEGNPSNVSPANAAVAANENCQFCETFAYANQVVLSPHHPVTISDAAESRVEDIRVRMEAVAQSNQAFPDMAVSLDDLTAELVAVVQGEIDRGGASATESRSRRTDTA